MRRPADHKVEGFDPNINKVFGAPETFVFKSVVSCIRGSFLTTMKINESINFRLNRFISCKFKRQCSVCSKYLFRKSPPHSTPKVKKVI